MSIPVGSTIADRRALFSQSPAASPVPSVTSTAAGGGVSRFATMVPPSSKSTSLHTNIMPVAASISATTAQINRYQTITPSATLSSALPPIPPSLSPDSSPDASRLYAGLSAPVHSLWCSSLLTRQYGKHLPSLLDSDVDSVSAAASTDIELALEDGHFVLFVPRLEERDLEAISRILIRECAINTRSSLPIGYAHLAARLYLACDKQEEKTLDMLCLLGLRMAARNYTIESSLRVDILRLNDLLLSHPLGARLLQHFNTIHFDLIDFSDVVYSWFLGLFCCASFPGELCVRAIDIVLLSESHGGGVEQLVGVMYGIWLTLASQCMQQLTSDALFSFLQDMPATLTKSQINDIFTYAYHDVFSPSAGQCIGKYTSASSPSVSLSSTASLFPPAVEWMEAMGQTGPMRFQTTQQIKQNIHSMKEGGGTTRNTNNANQSKKLETTAATTTTNESNRNEPKEAWSASTSSLAPISSSNSSTSFVTLSSPSPAFATPSPLSTTSLSPATAHQQSASMTFNLSDYSADPSDTQTSNKRSAQNNTMPAISSSNVGQVGNPAAAPNKSPTKPFASPFVNNAGNVTGASIASVTSSAAAVASAASSTLLVPSLPAATTTAAPLVFADTALLSDLTAAVANRPISSSQIQTLLERALRELKNSKAATNATNQSSSSHAPGINISGLHQAVMGASNSAASTASVSTPSASSAAATAAAAAASSSSLLVPVPPTSLLTFAGSIHRISPLSAHSLDRSSSNSGTGGSHGHTNSSGAHSQKKLVPNNGIIKYSEILEYQMFPTIIMQGYLLKSRAPSKLFKRRGSSGFFGHLNRRFFVLQGHFLTYFKTHSHSSPTRDEAVDLRRCVVHRIKKHEFAPFAMSIHRINTPLTDEEAVFLLFAENETTRDIWMETVALSASPSFNTTHNGE